MDDVVETERGRAFPVLVALLVVAVAATAGVRTLRAHERAAATAVPPSPSVPPLETVPPPVEPLGNAAPPLLAPPVAPATADLTLLFGGEQVERIDTRDDRRTTLYEADGSAASLQRLGHGLVATLFDSGGETTAAVVVTTGGDVHRVPLFPGSYVVAAADPDSFWVGDQKNVEVDRYGIDGRRRETVPLPPGWSALRGTAAGLLLLSFQGDTVALWRPGRGRPVPVAHGGAIVAAGTTFLAYRHARCPRHACTIDLIDLRTRRATPATFPEEYVGAAELDDAGRLAVSLMPEGEAEEARLYVAVPGRAPRRIDVGGVAGAYTLAHWAADGLLALGTVYDGTLDLLLYDAGTGRLSRAGVYEGGEGGDFVAWVAEP
jgi:hypothetical protein